MWPTWPKGRWSCIYPDSCLIFCHLHITFAPACAANPWSCTPVSSSSFFCSGRPPSFLHCSHVLLSCIPGNLRNDFLFSQYAHIPISNSYVVNNRNWEHNISTFRNDNGISHEGQIIIPIGPRRWPQIHFLPGQKLSSSSATPFLGYHNLTGAFREEVVSDSRCCGYGVGQVPSSLPCCLWEKVVGASAEFGVGTTFVCSIQYC